MIKALRILSLFCAISVVAAWASLGADRGWTKTSVAHTKVDPITEIEFVEYENRFVPGVDFLAAGLAGSAALFAFTLLLSKFQTKRKP